MNDYLDFELTIRPSGSEPAVYHVIVADSPAGQTPPDFQLRMQLPVTEAELKQLGDVTLEQLRDSSIIAAAQTLGKKLFDAIFSGEVRSLYDVSRQIADDQKKGLRLRLQIEAAELAHVPWELLFDSRKEFVSLTKRTPIVRFVATPRPPRALAVTLPLRILALVASPSESPPLNVALEKKRLEEAVADLASAGLVQLEWVAGQSWKNVQRTISVGTWHVLHFIGHGGFNEQTGGGTILFAGPEGETEQLDATRLARLVSDHEPLRLVVLGACDGARAGTGGVFTSVAGEMVRQDVPAVLAMQRPITADAARDLSLVFYQALADGLPVDGALTEARRRLSFDDSIEWSTPVLYSRAPDGVLFQMPMKPSPAESASGAGGGSGGLPVRDQGFVISAFDPPLPTAPDPNSPIVQLRALATQPAATVQRPVLRRLLATAFKKEELVLLCNDLSVDVENLGGDTKEMLALNLIQHLDRRGLLQQLLDALKVR